MRAFNEAPNATTIEPGECGMRRDTNGWLIQPAATAGRPNWPAIHLLLSRDAEFWVSAPACRRSVNVRSSGSA